MTRQLIQATQIAHSDVIGVGSFVIFGILCLRFGIYIRYITCKQRQAKMHSICIVHDNRELMKQNLYEGCLRNTSL